MAGAIVGGMALALGLLAALDPPVPRAFAPAQISGADARPDLGTLRRCRTVTVADAECEAAWDAKRRHFFGHEKDAR
ncbi:conjugative transfer region protein TrbK [Sphingopyxis sp. OAS728]|uniref:putative entry exclusion protein TrbK-alt n=1 Tax=Sphingopyxis sp. OAS728 TaxID=2663823 RepID=UPI00178A1199|nr:putative entry exclusion protein TrbK-alt [Sphingopyxis sp. OAS728]MBE1527883.1 conjugative transfer region protein TrbK [Sphingopyxis sp. OAS728]